VVQSGAGNNAVPIMFKEFGIRLTFTPTVLGNDLINLKVKPEVSALDFANGVNVGGFRVPALSTRRTETEVELANGQTFAIAGLMNNTVNSTMSKIPGIGDIPILGYLFKSRQYQKAETELVVMITPQIVQRGSTGVSSALPSIVEPYLGAPGKTMAQPAPYTGSPRYPVNAPAAGAPRTGGDVQPNAAQPMDPSSGATAPAANTVPTSPAAQPTAGMTTTAPATTAPVATPQTNGSPEQPEAKPSKSDQKAAAQQQAKDKDQARKEAEQQKKDADAAAKAQVAAAKKAQADKEHESKLAAEQQKKDAEAAKKAAEAERKKQDEQKKKDKDKAVADAAERLKQAQAEYDKTKSGGKQ